DPESGRAALEHLRTGAPLDSAAGSRTFLSVTRLCSGSDQPTSPDLRCRIHPGSVTATIPGGMMRKAMIAAALLTMAVSAPAAGQCGWTFGFLDGATTPTGDAGDYLKTGFNGGVLIGMRTPAGKVGFVIETQFHRHS